MQKLYYGDDAITIPVAVLFTYVTNRDDVIRINVTIVHINERYCTVFAVCKQLCTRE